MKKHGIRWYLTVSAIALLCAECIGSLLLCTLFSRRIVYDIVEDNCINQLVQTDGQMEAVYARVKRRMGHIASDGAIVAGLAEVASAPGRIGAYQAARDLETLLHTHLFDAVDIISFYAITPGCILAIEDKWQEAHILIGDYASDNLAEALQADYTRFVSAGSHPQQRIVQPVGQNACMVAIIDYQSALKGRENLMIESSDGQLLLNTTSYGDSGQLAREATGERELFIHASPHVDRIYYQLMEKSEIAIYWLKPLLLLVPVSLAIIGITVWFLVARARKISRVVLCFGDLVSQTEGYDAQQNIRDYVGMFKGYASLQTMVIRFYTFALIPLALLIAIHTFFYGNAMHDNLLRQAQARLQLVQENTEHELDEYKYLARFVSFSADIQNELLTLSGDGQYQQTGNELPRLLQNMGILGRNVSGVSFYDQDFRTIYHSSNAQDMEPLKETWLDYFDEMQVQTYWQVSDRRDNTYTMLWRVRYLPRSTLQARAFLALGYVRLDITGLFDRVTDGIRNMQTVHFAITDAQGDVLHGNMEANIPLYRTSAIADTPWTLNLYLDEAALRTDSYLYFSLNLWVFMLSALVMLIISFILTRQIKKPVRFLQSSILSDDQRALTAVAEITELNEFVILANNFGDMLMRMEDMNRELMAGRLAQVELEKREKEAELKALQMQISPHFLYNIFSSIQFLLLDKEIDQASRMIRAVGEFMRSGIYRGSQNISLEAEQRHVEAYVRLQSLRYGERLHFTADIQAGIGDVQVPRFILQPLIENSIEHGFPKKRALSVRLDIRETQEGFIAVQVEDDGTGMPPDILEKVKQAIRDGQQHKHIGLINVYERLRLFFGEESSFAITSIPQERTVVRLLFRQRMEG